jgi:dihydrofolate reductase
MLLSRSRSLSPSGVDRRAPARLSTRIVGLLHRGDDTRAAAPTRCAKDVVSSTLTTPLAWSNSTLLGGDLVTAVTKLKHRDGGPILVHGSATLAQGLLDANLVDDLRLMVFPVLVGGGKGIFPASFQKAAFTLSESETVLPNVVVHTYSRTP